jgi:hypothetical protein
MSPCNSVAYYIVKKRYNSGMGQICITPEEISFDYGIIVIGSDEELFKKNNWIIEGNEE